MKNTKTLVFVLSLFLLLGSIAFMFPVVHAADGKFESAETTLAFQGIDISPSGVLFAGAAGTIYRSADKGQTWTALHTFSGVTEIGCVFVGDNGYVYAIPAGRTILDSDRGVWRSVDSGSTWSRVLALDPASESTVLWGFDQDNSGRLFAAVYTYSSSVYNARIYRSTDNGATWASVYYDANCRHFHDLKVDRTNGYIYANTGDDPLPPGNAYILRSVDGGTTWTEILSGISQGVAICTTPSARFFGSDPNGGYIYRTTDDTTYTIVHSEPSGFYGYVAWIKRDPVSGQMFASIVDQTGTVPSKIITSVDGGNTWNTFRTFSTLGIQYGSAYASRFSGQTVYYSLNYATYQNGVKIEYVLPPPPQAVIYKISVNAQQHDDYGLGYPVTYVFEIPPEVTGGLRAYTRYSISDSWSRLMEKTSSDFFNGIECVRFDYAADRAYVTVAFSGVSDDIYIRLTDQSDSVVQSVYAGISEYYDNRKAAVTATHDDWDGYFTSNFDAAINAFQSRSIWFTGGFITQGNGGYTPRIPPDWVDSQTQIGEGYVEAASHSRSHSILPY
ncbi:MAG TPA: hypothetical protein VK253_05780, partial [Candidatus Binatia bacterium]|nr:hypothetical protein [Candidatus Binatia bacterium]